MVFVPLTDYWTYDAVEEPSYIGVRNHRDEGLSTPVLSQNMVLSGVSVLCSSQGLVFIYTLNFRPLH